MSIVEDNSRVVTAAAAAMSAAGLTQSRLDGMHRGTLRTGLFQCLVVSIDAERCEMLARAAADGGWHTIACRDAEAAQAYLRRMLVQLTVVDMDHPADAEPHGYRELLQEISRMTGLLLVVCGKPGDWRQELIARQLGAWLYLPGVESDGLTLMCGEARQVVEQLSQAAKRAESR